MNRKSSPAAETPSDAWTWAVRLMERWLTGSDRLDWLLETLPASLPSGERARVQALLVGTVRNYGRIQGELDQLMQRPPRPVVSAGLLVAGFELLAGGGDGHGAKVAHHLVERLKRLASPKEAGFANAVGRRLVAALAKPLTEPAKGDSTEQWARFYSHPEWLIQRWWDNFGVETTRQLLVNHQNPAPVVVRKRPGFEQDQAPDWLQPLAGAPDFMAADSGHWPELLALIEARAVHVQDAATELAIDLLQPVAGETVLDLCAAPGGKSLAIADRMQSGKVVAFDVPGRRMARLQETLGQTPAGVATVTVSGDLMLNAVRALEAKDLPTTYDAVLIDVPCSNTGVMRHRVDIKWRIQPDSFKRHALQQLDMLIAASERVAPGGRIVYSTCSIDREENEQVANAFVEHSQGTFVLEDSRTSLPWETGHDGAAAYRLRRV